ncbi:TetR/AcrR family transcriptional regulator [Nocardia sp. NPDC004568]|uniref:TetR/AcrR family transcriptional regulator n=1 Tax=Nocardia sp. NPDC004568 TaxID=3154551 RepID=UPI0033A4383D
MPKLVDHVERRRAIIEAAWRLIADRGIDGITMRDLAAEAGYANGALSHYFSGKDEILCTAFEYVIESTDLRIENSVGARHGLAALRRMCLEIMPVTDETRLEARIAVSLWQRAMNDPAMAEFNNVAVAAWKSRLTRYWAEAIAAGELPDTDLGIGVESLMTMMIGLQVTAVLGAAASSRRSQLAMVDSLLGATPG